MKKIGLLLFAIVFLGITKGNAQQLDLQAQIDAAQEGSIVQLGKGVYKGNIVITKPIVLEGVEGTIIKSNADAPAITVDNTSNVTIRNITIETLGTGMTIRKGNDIKLSNIYMKNVDAGIKIYNTQHVLGSELTIEGNAQHYSKKGNGIAIYESHSIELLDNDIRSVQDGFYIEHVKDVMVQNNTVKKSRYGTHFMYSTEGTIRENTFTENVTALMVMMTENIQVEDNIASYQNDFNGTGITLYDTKAALLQHNKLAGNRVGVSIQKSTDIQLTNNTLHMNQTALESIRSDESNTAMQNQFIGNLVNVRSDKEGLTLQQNYYDDYSGIDLDDDGTGDEAYVALQSFGQWMVRKPVYQYFIESPSVVLLNTIDKQTNNTTKELLVDTTPQTVINKEKNISLQLDVPQLLIGMLLLVVCVFIYRRSVQV